jgi:DNA-binding Xre family transcriptional regulator
MATSVEVGTRFRLRELLEDAKMSQSELARRSGVSFVTINRMCANATEGVSLKTLDAIAAALKVEPGELLERESAKRKRR